MRRRLPRASICAWAIILPLAATAAPPPLELYGADPETSDVRISADGTKLAMLVARPDFKGLMIVDVDTGRTIGGSTGDLKVRQIDWSGPNHVLLYVSKTTNIAEFRSSKIEFGGVFSIDIRNMGAPVQLLESNKGLALQTNLWGVRAYLGNENGDVLMAARVDRKGSRNGTEDLLLVNGATGRGSVIARGTAGTRDWVVSPKGYVVARVDYMEKSDQYRVLVPMNEQRLGEWESAFIEETEIPYMKIYGASANERGLIVGTWLKSDRSGLFEMSLDSGAINEALFEHDVVDVGSAIKDQYTGAIVGANYVVNGPEQIYFQNDLQAVLSAAQKALPEKSVQISSWDRNRRRFVIFAEGTGDAGSYFLLDVGTGQLRLLAAARPQLRSADVATVTPFFYKARDGMRIHAFLTAPPGRELRNLPLVVLPHGGPASRDSISFDYWAQFLASRGYAVLQMNFRGSDGYGKDFENAGNYEWGGKMQDDVTDGVHYVIDEGIAAPGRICIAGGSYGGYAALAGAAFTPDLYKCAVSFAGVGDLGKMLAWEQTRYGAQSSAYTYWVSTIGDPTEHGPQIAAASPLNAVDRIEADVLLIHGKDDTVVPYQQSQQMAEALLKAGKNVQLVTLVGEDHWLSSAATRTDMLRAMEGFLARHLGTHTPAK